MIFAVHNLKPDHRGKRILYNHFLKGVLVDVEPHEQFTGLVLAEHPGFRWLVPSGAQIIVTEVAA